MNELDMEDGKGFKLKCPMLAEYFGRMNNIPSTCVSYGTRKIPIYRKHEDGVLPVSNSRAINVSGYFHNKKLLEQKPSASLRCHFVSNLDHPGF